MWTEQEFINLEQEELEITNEAILTMLLVMAGIKGDLEREIRDFYARYGNDGVVTYQEARKWVSETDHRKRSVVLVLFITDTFVSAYSKLEKHFRKFLTEVIAKESTLFGVSVDVEKLLNRKWGVDDLYWLQRLENDVNLWKLTVAKDVKQMIHKGATLDTVMAQLNKRFKSIDYVLKKLGLSESTAVGSLARQTIFKELGIAKYRFYTKADERTCEQCGALHGLVFPISAFEVGVTASPIHPHCRCWEVPILE